MKLVLMLFPWVFLVVSCAENTHKAPISDIHISPPKRIDYHVVAPGETLYSIALTYDLEYKKLAKINGLGDKYAIVPGQRLSLNPDDAPAKEPEISEEDQKLQKVADTLVNAAKEVVQSIKKQTVSSVKKPTKPQYSAKLVWQWPVSGKVLRNFKSNDGLNKGIDLQGELGESIHAAAEGEVIYAGSGLRDYGNLLILKHQGEFLSAYAHCRVLKVKEGDKVKRGDKVAEIGHSGSAQTTLLHFEIRVRGKPVDPAQYLPPK